MKLILVIATVSTLAFTNFTSPRPLINSKANSQSEPKIFWEKFIASLKNDNTDQLCSLIQLPLIVECYSDRTKGDTIKDLIRLKQTLNRIFNDSVKSRIIQYRFVKSGVNNKDPFEVSIGFTKEDKDPALVKEYGLLFRFKLIKSSWKLFRIQRVG